MSMLIYLVAILLVIIAPFRWIVWRRRFKRHQSEVTELRAAVRSLQAQITRLQPLPTSQEKGAEPPPEPTIAVPEPEPVPPEPHIEASPAASIIPPVQISEPATESSALERPEDWRQFRPQVPILTAKMRERLAAAFAESFDGADWETLIGGKWLNVIGVVVLVIGMVMFLGYSLQYTGPAGKVATGLLTSVALLAGGIVLERRERYRLFAKPLIGGGWALLYFTVYAAYNIAAAKIIYAPGLALSLLGVVAAGMILHALKYRSEVAAGLAYVLAFLALAISPLTDLSFVASFILAASLVAILWAIPWYHLGPLGVAATYLIHFLWLHWPLGGVADGVPAQPFWLSQGILVVYWVLFTGFAFVRKPETARQEWLSLTTNATNSLGFLGLSLLHVGNNFPDHVYVLTGGAAVAYVMTSPVLRVAARHKHHLVDGSVAIGLVAATFPLALRSLPLDNDWLAIPLLVEAGAVLALGFYLREVVFRIGAYLLSLAVFLALFTFNLYGLPAGRHLVLWLTVVPAVAYFYYLFERLQRAAGRDDVRKEAGHVGIICGYAAAVVLAAFLWKVGGRDLAGAAWLGVGLLLFEVGTRISRLHLRVQGYILATLALGALFSINLYEVIGQPEVSRLPRWAIVSPAILAFYYLFWRLQRLAVQGVLHDTEKEYVDVPSHAATVLLTVLLWRELDAVAVALAWGFLGLALFEAGTTLNQKSLKAHAHVLGALAFGRLFLANFTAPGEALGLSHRLVTVVPIVAMFYFLRFRLGEEQETEISFAFEKHLAQAYSYGAVILLVILARFEIGRAHAVMVWALLLVIFLTLGLLWRNRDFRIQSYLIAVLSFGRSWSTNVYLIGSYYGISERVATTVPVIAAFLAATFLWRSKQKAFAVAAQQRPSNVLTRLESNARILFPFLAAALATIFLYYEVEGNLLTIGWTVEAFALLALGFVAIERSFRIYGLVLLSVCLLKVVVIDLAGIETLYRIFSFIVLGLILLAASFGYTRYRHLIKPHL